MPRPITVCESGGTAIDSPPSIGLKLMPDISKNHLNSSKLSDIQICVIETMERQIKGVSYLKKREARVSRRTTMYIYVDDDDDNNNTYGDLAKILQTAGCSSRIQVTIPSESISLLLTKQQCRVVCGFFQGEIGASASE